MYNSIYSNILFRVLYEDDIIICRKRWSYMLGIYEFICDKMCDQIVGRRGEATVTQWNSARKIDRTGNRGDKQTEINSAGV